MVPFLGHKVQAPKKKSYSEKIRIEHRGQVYLPTKYGRDEKSWLMHKALPLCKDSFSRNPVIL